MLSFQALEVQLKRKLQLKADHDEYPMPLAGAVVCVPQAVVHHPPLLPRCLQGHWTPPKQPRRAQSSLATPHPHSSKVPELGQLGC